MEERRSANRYALPLPLEYRTRSGDAGIGIIADISAKSARMELDRPYPISTQLGLRVAWPPRPTTRPLFTSRSTLVSPEPMRDMRWSRSRTTASSSRERKRRVEERSKEGHGTLGLPPLTAQRAKRASWWNSARKGTERLFGAMMVRRSAIRSL
jgi:hypothetical protein